MTPTHYRYYTINGICTTERFSSSYQLDLYWILSNNATTKAFGSQPWQSTLMLSRKFMVYSTFCSSHGWLVIGVLLSVCAHMYLKITVKKINLPQMQIVCWNFECYISGQSISCTTRAKFYYLFIYPSRIGYAWTIS